MHPLMKLTPARHALSMLATIGVLALGAASAHAHPGHGARDASALHMLSSPYHLAVLALSGAVLLLAGRFARRQLPRRVLQGAGLAALGAATALWGLHI